MRLLLAVLAAGALSSASADDETMHERFVPPQCEPFWKIPGGMDSPVAWSQVFSFAACIQDARLVSVDDARDLPALIEQFDTEMMPALELYAAAIRHGPEEVKLQAVYHLGMSQVALLTRLRLSAGRSPELRAKLEPLLLETAELAYKSFAMFEMAVDRDPSLVSDPVTEAMARSVRDMSESLAVAFAFGEDEPPVIAR